MNVRVSRRAFLATGGLFAVGALLANCGSSSTSNSTAQKTSGSSPSSAASSAANSTAGTPSTGAANTSVKSSKNIINFPLIDNPGTLNPIMASSTAEDQVCQVIHGSLLRLDPMNFQPMPYLAKSWEVSSDGKLWTFHLNDDVTFHDGTKCTADDVKFTMDAMINPKINSANGKQFAGFVTKTVVVDPATVEFQMASSWAALPVILAGRWQVAPKHILQSVDIATDTSFNKKPIGIGPYSLSSWSQGQDLVLKAYKGFFLGVPKIETAVFKIIPDTNVQVAQLRTSELDAIPFFSIASISSVQNQPGLSVDFAPQSIWYAVHLNMNRQDLFGDRRVRQALSYAIDRQALITNVLHGHGQIATGPIIPAIKWAYDPNVMKFPYDPAKAKSLLGEAGWTQSSDGGWQKGTTKLEFPLQEFTDATVVQTATLIQQNWADIGVKTHIQTMDFSAFITNVRDNRGAQNGFYSYVCYMTPEPEPDGIYAYFDSKYAATGSDFTAYKNPEVDHWLDIGRQGTNQAQRKEAYVHVQEILAQDQTRIFLFYPPGVLVRHPNLTGYPGVSIYNYLERAYFK